MAISLSKDAVLFQASAQPVFTELDRTDKRLDQFKKRTESPALQPVIRPILAMPDITGFVGRITAALTAGFSFAWFTSKLTDAANQARATLRNSAATGLSTEKIGGLDYLARLRGMNTEGLSEGLRHYNMRLGEALAGNQSAVASFREMGIQISDLRSLNADQIFDRVNESISGMQDPFRRASVEHDLLGRHGQALVAILRQQPAAIRAATQEAVNFGLAMGQARTQQANSGLIEWRAAWVRLDGIIRGVANTIMSTLGPIIQRISKVIGDFFGQWVLDKQAVDDFVESAVIGLAMVYDAIVRAVAWAVGTGLPNLIRGFVALRGVITSLLSPMTAIYDMAVALGQAAGGANTGTDLAAEKMARDAEAWARGAEAIGEQMRRAGVAEATIREVIDKMHAERNKPEAGAARPGPDLSPLWEQRDRLREALHYWGLTTDQIAQQKLLEQDLTAEDRRKVEALIEENRQRQQTLDLIERNQKLAEAGHQVTEQFLSPYEKLQEEIQRLNEMLQNEAIDPTTYTRAIAQAWRTATANLGEKQFGELILKGSAQEIQTIQRFQYGSGSETNEARARRLQEELLNEQRIQTDLDRQVLQALQQLNNNSPQTLEVLTP